MFYHNSHLFPKSTKYLPSLAKIKICFPLDIPFILFATLTFLTRLTYHLYFLKPMSLFYICYMFSCRTLLFLQRLHLILWSIWILVTWQLFMPRVKLSSLFLLANLKSRILGENFCVLCLVSIWELFMFPRMKRMMMTTMLLNPFIMF